jgi:transcriptional regulator with XRE-family HTH domain
MNMYIGENIKRLRKNKNITQEKLAEYLTISCQAVSKWERAESFPDITFIIPIASYFGVSTDELLGVDYARNEQKIRDYLAEYDRLSNLGKEKEKCNLIRKAYKEFPNDFRIIDKHMSMLVYDPYIEGHNPKICAGIVAHIDELTRLCDRVLDECTIDNTRYLALSILIDIYEYLGEREKALKTIEQFPDGSFTKGQQYEQFYRYGTPEWLHWTRNNIYNISENIIVKFRNCAIASKSKPKERIKQFFKAVDYIKLLYENGDYGFAHYHLCELYIYIANRYMEQNDYEKAAEYLDLGLSHGKLYDELPEITVHSSFLVNGYEFDKRKVYSGFEGNNVMREIEIIDTREFYNKFRDMDWFEAVLDKYRFYAKDTK